MAEKRKDHKGRILKTGESQRKDLLYQYRYTDKRGKRHTIYNSDLQKLRKEEVRIQQELQDGICASDGDITVLELVKVYIELKQNVGTSRKIDYTSTIHILERPEDKIANKRIKDVKGIDVRRWAIELNDTRGYGTINCYHQILKAAFTLAASEDMIRKNPINYRLSDVIKKDTKKREALTSKQQQELLAFVKECMENKKLAKHEHYVSPYDLIVILLGTGLRAGELCGLTLNDIDFENRKINIKQQMCEYNSTLTIESPKSKAGFRAIPMTDNVYNSLQSVIKNRPVLDAEPVVDGVSRFVFLSTLKMPLRKNTIEQMLSKKIMKLYREKHPESTMITVTPHVLRHTFCTNLIKAGMGVKSVQYLMGHASAQMTLNIYTHTNYENVADEMRRLDLDKPTNIISIAELAQQKAVKQG